jgi:hypothetical protein
MRKRTAGFKQDSARVESVKAPNPQPILSLWGFPLQARCYHCLNVLLVYNLHYPHGKEGRPTRYYRCPECGETARVDGVKMEQK